MRMVYRSLKMDEFYQVINVYRLMANHMIALGHRKSGNKKKTRLPSRV